MSLDRSRSDGRGRPSTPLSVDVFHEPGEVVAVIRGNLDRATVPVLTVCLEEIVAAFARYPTLVVDLAHVRSFDVRGVSLLLHTAERAAARGVRLHLAGCSGRLLRLLHLSDDLDGLAVITAPAGC